MLAIYLFTQAYSPLALSQDAPQMLLAKNYQQGIDVQHYLVSEKYDGVRAFWNGKQLISRQGYVIHAPQWFIQNFPTIALDGELWIGRGQFDALSGIVRKSQPMDAEWKNIRYFIFELPNGKGNFEARAKRIVEIVKLANLPQLKAVAQFRVRDEHALNLRLQQVVEHGGEGLMLHRADALYTTGRSDALLKMKLAYDAEATVIGHTPGKGKYAGKLGALVVETPQGVRFKLGTGFTDEQRETPPKIGTIVTYTYKGITQNGKPKFASFLRVRQE